MRIFSRGSYPAKLAASTLYTAAATIRTSMRRDEEGRGPSPQQRVQKQFAQAAIKGLAVRQAPASQSLPFQPAAMAPTVWEKALDTTKPAAGDTLGSGTQPSTAPEPPEYEHPDSLPLLPATVTKADAQERLNS